LLGSLNIANTKTNIGNKHNSNRVTLPVVNIFTTENNTKIDIGIEISIPVILLSVITLSVL
jgi:hypothetical protein